jgi:membrane protease YdiL (CAAX protease family)
MNLLKKHKVFLVITPVLFITGTLIFAAFPRNPGSFLNISYAGLVLVAAVIAFNIRKPVDFLKVFGLNAIPREKLHLFLAGLLTGVFFATIYRKDLEASEFPDKLTLFALTAAAIGFTEELLFRGFLQERLRKMSIFWSVVIAACSHTAYKILLFASLRPLYEVDLLYLGSWTFICGLLFSVLKERSGSTLTPVSGHVTFDILVYGDQAQIPWWIWA